MGLLARYHAAKSGLGAINPRDMTQLGEDWLIAAATGAGIGLVSASIGGLDKKVAGLPVPVDGAIAVGLGIAGLSMRGESAKVLKIASIAAGGAVATRKFTDFFKSGLHIKGELDDLQGGYGGMGFGGLPFHGQQRLGQGVGFGRADTLVEAARYL